VRASSFVSKNDGIPGGISYMGKADEIKTGWDIREFVLAGGVGNCQF